ncbi:hypothetical protein A6A04_00115 [Paramagnetospirillum marisnigri]|uniref:protein O-GlcNAc transferase n=1 Tax=Paramagnetospirillum marisnigri TaxID=1285242 RepID=A0A178MSC3_9PROT|nr:tetratricopeptide repeat protein [Paramagnetospirillum marisnigri]OAN52152.1 hypothetical protein A6A04_00115 [Paramagnetospirillum marisnigri]
MSGAAQALAQAEALLRAGNAAEAAKLCQRLRKAHPKLAEAAKLAGMAAYLLGRHAEAETALAAYVKQVPNDPGGLVNLGNAQQALGKAARAADSFRRALALVPDAAPIHYNLGSALHDLNDCAAAADSFGRAVALRPDYGKAWAALGMVLAETGRAAEAAEAYGRAVALDLGSARLRSNLGSALQDAGRLDEAIVAHEAAVKLAPDSPECHNNLGTALFAVARQSDAMAEYRAALALDPMDLKAHRNLLAAAIYLDDLTDDDLAELHRQFGRSFARPVRPLPPRPPRREIRIGYLSSDLRAHPVAGNLLPVVARMDRAGFPAYFYAQIARPDAMTEKFKAIAAGWRDITGLSDAQVAERIRADRIDILVSLAGRFDENRPTVCAERVAPVQLSLHEVATSGLDQMDYLIGDPVLLPKGGAEFFTERPLRMPHFYIADMPDDLPPLRDPAPSPGPVFCCFNNPAKITPAVLAVWGRILKALPEARLVLKYQTRYGARQLSDRFARLLAEAGARPHQVEMVAEAESYAAFMDRYNDADFALDPFPFSGSTTSFQSLCMGVPVVTWPWPRMISRWTRSIQKPLGLDEFTAASADDYVAVALRAVANREHWRAQRAELRARLFASPLCDGATWARNLERLLRAVWRRHLARTRLP